ncbi:PRC-barrel domain-containing protein [Lichenifustis flavocetrariae]|uniref:PRC-barrel domain-containing protein n=1 Tax=Lichenifustis flavocetrariae TaxID=2949735 RepID=A0AA41Z3C2_9HYPH|nr:PRC-barrel domain-containing protein [Lichenifustis flavocetrariae]MCW6512133.1 PRC-barrel domain-containing protein [Lichenifustis flavocetrariae]
MLIAISVLKGYAVEASDAGRIGTIHDILFDDRTWKMRWLVVDVGSWLNDRKVLVHPSAIRAPDYVGEILSLALTKAQVEASPSSLLHEPVSARMETRLYDYYGSGPIWGSGYFGAGAFGSPLSAMIPTGGSMADSPIEDEPAGKSGDPNLRSFAEVIGYHMHATDGMIGHAANFLIDDGSWDVRYIIIDTKDWWPGARVLISPYAVQAVRWTEGEIRLDVDRETVKTSPPWDPIAMIDQVYEKKLHRHYGWRGYGF